MNTKVGRRRSGYWLNSVVVCVTALIGFLLIWAHGCSGSQNAVNHETTATTSNTPVPPDSVITTEDSIPTAIADTGEYGQNLYESAKANDWNSARVKLEALRESAKDVHTQVNQSDATDSLDEHVAALGLAVAVKDRQTAMRDANRVTLDIAYMSAAYNLSVPVEVSALDYYGRELEIWAEAKDANNLQSTAREMRRTWNSLRKSVEARSAPEEKKFGALVARVESARTPTDYANVAPLVLDEVDNLEKLFQ